MPQNVESFSLNKAADRCNFSRQEFRKFVGEFERQTRASLPTNYSGGKEIPADFLPVFQRAVLWSQVEGYSPTLAMSTALESGQQYRLQELAQAVANTTELLKLPSELRRTINELEHLSKKPRPVQVVLKDSKDIAQSLASIALWQGTACTLLGLVLGVVLSHRFGW